MLSDVVEEQQETSDIDTGVDCDLLRSISSLSSGAGSSTAINVEKRVHGCAALAALQAEHGSGPHASHKTTVDSFEFDTACVQTEEGLASRMMQRTMSTKNSAETKPRKQTHYGIESAVRPNFFWEAHTLGSAYDGARSDVSLMKTGCQDEVIVIDEFCGDSNLTFVGIFDGHGPYGGFLATFVARYIPSRMAERLGSNANEDAICEAFKVVCAEAHDAIMNSSPGSELDAYVSGTTACMAVLSGSKIVMANVGDSRGVLGYRDSSTGMVKAHRLTIDDKPEHPAEISRIEAAGGAVRQFKNDKGEPYGSYRVFRRGDDLLPGLSMSRSIGDTYAKEFGVIHTPSISVHSVRDEDLYLILATDGVWDIVDDATAMEFVDRYSKCRIDGVSSAEALTFEAQERWKLSREEMLVDDMSSIVVYLQPKPKIAARIDFSRELLQASSTNAGANDTWMSRQEPSSPTIDPATLSPRPIFHFLGKYLELCPNNSFSRTDSPFKQAQAADVHIISRRSSGIPTPESPLRMKSAFSFTPSQAIGVPGIRKVPSTHRSAPVRQPLSEADAELRPIRKAHPSQIGLNSAWTPEKASLSCRSLSDVWLIDGMDTPRSSESNLSGRAAGLDERPHRGELRHEGKVHRGIPCSYSSFGQGSHERLSTDSDASQALSRHGSFVDDYSLTSGMKNLELIGSPKGKPNVYTQRAQTAATIAMSYSRSYGSLKEEPSGPGLKRSGSKVFLLREPVYEI